MYSHIIDEMAEEIATETLMPLIPIESIKACLLKYWNDKIAVVWHIDDIVRAAKEIDISLTEEEASDILEDIFRQHDASIGINWTVIKEAIRDYLLQK